MQPFFIVGSARSGTTLLRLMFNAHSKVAIPPESRFVVELYNSPQTESGKDEVAVDSFLEELGRHRGFRVWDLPIDLVRAEFQDGRHVSYADAIGAAFGAYARAHRKSFWGDKTPRYIEHLPLLARLFPTARFVHVVRDGRNVALSYADVPFGPKTVGKAAALWAERVATGVRDGRPLEDRYTEILYEDLVEEPEERLKFLCAFLGLDFESGMLDYTERTRDQVLPRHEAYNPHVMQKPLRQVRSWEKDMPPGQIEMFEAIAGDVLERFDYKRRHPQPGERARVLATLSRLGLPVGRLQGKRKA